MTRKHFEAIAWALKVQRPECSAPLPTPAELGRLAQWLSDCKAIADACYQFNGQFDRERFLDAAGTR